MNFFDRFLQFNKLWFHSFIPLTDSGSGYEPASQIIELLFLNYFTSFSYEISLKLIENDHHTFFSSSKQ